ncbi:MAG: hypothetical protein JKY33_00900 [Bacteroidia bacterium]|nr:hypothetical protein [Bacteroidia bacterium]
MNQLLTAIHYPNYGSSLLSNPLSYIMERDQNLNSAKAEDSSEEASVDDSPMHHREALLKWLLYP